MYMSCTAWNVVLGGGGEGGKTEELPFMTLDDLH